MSFMETETLIQRLAQSSDPVARLPRPSTRSALWLALAIPYVALVVLVMSPRSDLVAKLSDTAYVVEQVAALATGITAGLAAFASIVPGFDRRILLLPVLPLAAWFGSVGLGCVRSWAQLGPDGLSLQSDWICFPAIVLVSMVPAIALAVMLRRGAPLTPHLTAALGGSAAAGLGNFGLRLFHPQDASIMVLVWQMGTVFILTVLAGWSGRLLLNWRLLTDTVRRRIAPH
jgi:hypothetical protein